MKAGAAIACAAYAGAAANAGPAYAAWEYAGTCAGKKPAYVVDTNNNVNDIICKIILLVDI